MNIYVNNIGVGGSSFKQIEKKLSMLLLFTVLLSFLIVSCGGVETKKAPPAGALRSAPASISFGSGLPISIESPVKKFVITNTSAVEVTDISYSLKGGQDKIFLVGSDCTKILPPGAKCNVSAAIKPDLKGKSFNEFYQVSYVADKGIETLSIKMSGDTINAAGVELENLDNIFLSGLDGGDGSPKKTFDTTEIGTVSDVVSLGVTNQGNKSVTVQITSPSNKVFRTVSDCVSLASGDRCNIFASFAPTDAKIETGSLKINATQDGAAIKTENISLAGTGKTPTPSAVIKLYDKADTTQMLKELTFSPATVKVGELSDNKTLVLENTSSTPFLYRLSSTLPSVSVDYGTCTGRLAATGDEKSKCEFNITYGPSVVGSDVGYIRYVSGKSSQYIKVTGTAVAATSLTVGDVTIDKDKIVFSSTEKGFASEQKVLTLKNNTTTASGRISLNLTAVSNSYSFTSSCVDNAPLSAGASCEVFLIFRPITTGAQPGELEVKVAAVTGGTAADNKKVTLTGTGYDQLEVDNTTNISGLTISHKKYSFPDTGVGLKSSAVQFTLTNNSGKDITGFLASTTDLLRFPLAPDLTDCKSTIKDGESCVIAFSFNASAATQYKGFVKIFANGAESDGVTGIEGAPELVELFGRGVLFNQNVFFGYVDNTFKDVVFAAVNDTALARKITKTEVETVRWIWKARDNNYAYDDNNKNNVMTTWFPNKTENLTVANNIFERKSIATVASGSTVPTDALFSIVTDNCKGQTVEAGGSCIIKVRYHGEKQATLTDGTKPVSAYIKLYSDDEGSDVIIDQFHAVASGEDNATYFFPPEQKIGAVNYERPIVIWDSQAVVIDQNIYTYSGAGANLPGGYSADSKVRRYDAARNAWKELKTSGTDYLSMKWAGVSAGQVRMIAYNKKLYFFGGQVKDASDGLLGLSNYIALLDLDTKTATSDAAWVSLGATTGSIASAPATMTSNGRGQPNMAGLNNRIYVWGGLQNDPRNVFFFDLKELKWFKAGQEKDTTASIADVPAGCTIQLETENIPTRRGYAAMIFFGNKLFMHAGMHNTSMDAADCTRVNPIGAAYLYNDLWSYEVESYDDNGNKLHSDDVNKWTRLTDILGGDATVGTGTASATALSATFDDLRPFSREKHEWDVVGNRLLLKASGFHHSNGNGQVSIGPSNEYFFFDPASGGKKPGAVTEADLTNGWKKAGIITRDLAQHKLFIINGVVWFYNKNIMGVQFSKEIAELSNKK